MTITTNMRSSVFFAVMMLQLGFPKLYGEDQKMTCKKVFYTYIKLQTGLIREPDLGDMPIEGSFPVNSLPKGLSDILKALIKKSVALSNNKRLTGAQKDLITAYNEKLEYLQLELLNERNFLAINKGKQRYLDKKTELNIFTFEAFVKKELEEIKRERQEFIKFILDIDASIKNLETLQKERVHLSNQDILQEHHLDTGSGETNNVNAILEKLREQHSLNQKIKILKEFKEDPIKLYDYLFSYDDSISILESLLSRNVQVSTFREWAAFIFELNDGQYKVIPYTSWDKDKVRDSSNVVFNISQEIKANTVRIYKVHVHPGEKASQLLSSTQDVIDAEKDLNYLKMLLMDRYKDVEINFLTISRFKFNSSQGEYYYFPYYKENVK